MQTHFDNAAYESGVHDSSGTIFYYQYTPVSSNIGIFQVGDGRLTLNGQSLPSGISRSDFECPGSCTGGWTTAEEFTVLDIQLHMHTKGDAMQLKHERGGEVRGEVLMCFVWFGLSCLHLFSHII